MPIKNISMVEGVGGRDYYVDAMGRNKENIAEYIRNQLNEDIINDQMTFKEYCDLFTGSRNN